METSENPVPKMQKASLGIKKPALPYSSLLNCCEQTKVYMDFGLECWRLIVSILMLRNEFWQRSPNGAEGGGGAGTVIPFRDFFKFLLGLRAFPWRMEVADRTWSRVGKTRERRGRFSAAYYHKSTGAVFSGGISGMDVKYLGGHLQHFTLSVGYSDSSLQQI